MALTAYILDGTEPVPIDLSDLAELARLERWLQEGKNILEQTEVGAAFVSTVFLITRGSPLLMVDARGRLQLFETLLSAPELGDRFYHYGSHRLALSGHRHLVAYLRRRLAP